MTATKNNKNPQPKTTQPGMMRPGRPEPQAVLVRAVATSTKTCALVAIIAR